MAKKKKATKKFAVKGFIELDRKEGNSGFPSSAIRAKFIEREARLMLTIDFREGEEVHGPEPGAMVRVRPVGVVDSRSVEDLAKLIKEKGAAIVKVLPTATVNPTVTEQAVVPAVMSLREAVERLVGDDQPLAELCGSVLDQVGV